MTTKFFTCTLSILYRGKDDQGEIQGGVMYYIEQGLGEKYKPLALMFAISGMIGCTIFFQANQLSQIIREYFYNPSGVFQGNIFIGDLVTGILVSFLVSIVIFGGIKRIAIVASKMVPIMVGIYLSDNEVGIYSIAALFAEGFLQIFIVIQNNVNPIISRYFSSLVF